MDVMCKAANLQNQVKQNNTDLTDFLKDLTRWEENVRNEDHNLKAERKLEEKLPPIRSKEKKPTETTPATTTKEIKTEAKEEKKARISSYDYDAWSKFDVDAACKNVEEEKVEEEEAEAEETEEEEEEETEDAAEEIDKLRIQRALQKAVMEKEKGNQLFKEGKYDAAINRYSCAINLHPHNPVLYANRGMALMKKEQYAAAEQDCDVALQLDPAYVKAIARRGTARKKLKKYKEALEDFAHLLEVEPKNQQAVHEIKDINHLIAKSKELCKKSEVKSKNDAASKVVSEVKLKNTKATDESVKKSRRSNKPLKRIHITEVGIDEPEKEKNENVTPQNNNTPQVINVAPQISELCVPTTSFMFETELKRLKNNMEQLYSYIKLIPLAEYGKLFYQSIDNVISPFLAILKDYYIRDNIAYHEQMDIFSDVSRFNMAVMFLSSKDKETLKYLLTNLSSESYKCHLPPDGIVAKLSKKYNVKL